MIKIIIRLIFVSDIDTTFFNKSKLYRLKKIVQHHYATDRGGGGGLRLMWHFVTGGRGGQNRQKLALRNCWTAPNSLSVICTAWSAPVTILFDACEIRLKDSTKANTLCINQIGQSVLELSKCSSGFGSAVIDSRHIRNVTYRAYTAQEVHMTSEQCLSL